MVRTKEASRPSEHWPDFRRLWSSQAVSLVGDQVTTLALPLVAVLTLHAGPAQVGLVSGARTAPVIAMSLAAGLLVDRWGRRRLMVRADLLRAAAIALVPLLAVLGGLSLPLLIAITITLGALAVVFDTAAQAYVADLLPPNRLTTANSRLQVAMAGAQVGGPGLAGILVQLLTAPVALLADTLSFLVSAGLLARIRTADRPRRSPRQRPAAELRDGFAATYRDPVLRALAFTAAHANLIEQALLTLLAIRFVGQQHHSPAELGVVLALGAIGALVSGAATARLSRWLRTGTLILAGEFLAASGLVTAALLLAAPSTPPALLTAAFLLYGLGEGVGNVLYVTVRQRHVPPDLLGRSYGSYRLLVSGTTPVGPLVAGALAQTLGTPTTLITLAMIAAGIPAWLISSAIWRTTSA